MSSRRVVFFTSVITTYGLYKYIHSEKNKGYIHSTKSLPDHPTSIIIGTGIIGLTSAYYLAKSGHKVICIEKREDVALETSYKNGALICPSLLTPWANSHVPKNYIKSIFSSSSSTSSALTSTKIWPSSYFSLKFYRWIYEYLKNCTTKAQIKNAAHLLTLSMYSRQCLDDILNENSISFSRYSNGSLQLAIDPIIFEQLIEESKHIDNIQILSTADEVIKHEPILTNVKDRIYGGIFSSLDTNGNIYEFCCQLKQILIEKYNVQFLFNEQVQDFIISTTNENHRHITGIITNENKIVHNNINNIILTNGNYVMPLMEKFNIFIPVYPVKGYVVEIFTPPNIPLPTMNLVDDVNKLYMSPLKPTDKQGIFRVSGLAEFAGWKDIGILSEPDRAQYLYEQTIQWLPHLASYEKAFHSCSRPVSADDVPLIGRCGNFDNLFVNCGHGSKGWTLAFGSAAILANVINQNTDIMEKNKINPEAYSPNRF